jgi:RNA polymerase sigma-70 factor (ECF subfamily)
MKVNDDTALVTEVILHKSTVAFGALVKKYQSSIRRFFLQQTLGDEALSDDLAQETFIKAFDHIMGFRQQASFSTWLFRIAYNVFYDYHRSKKITVDVETNEMAQGLHMTSLNVEAKLDVYAAMRVLKEIERTCITLFHLEDLSIDDIALVMKCPTGTIKSHLSRGREKMANYLKTNGYERKRR